MVVHYENDKINLLVITLFSSPYNTQWRNTYDQILKMFTTMPTQVYNLDLTKNTMSTCEKLRS
jgi:hypothetical protein